MSADKRQRGRPAMFTDQERLQRKREMARLRQARKRARDRERQSLGRDSLGSGMDLDSGDIGVAGGGRSESGEHSLTQDGGTDDELNDDEDSAFIKGLEIAGSEEHARQNGSSSAGGGERGGGGAGGGAGAGAEAVMRGRGEPRGKGVEVAPQPPPVVVPGIAPMQLHPVHHHEMQGIAASSGTETPATQAAVGSMNPHERVPVVVYSDQPRRISGNVVVAMEEEDGDDEESGDNHALFWPWLRQTVRLIESSRNNRKLQEEIYTVLYTEEMARMMDREAHRLTNQQPELLKEKVSSTPELGDKNIVTLGLSDEGDKESGDEMVDELLGHLEGRIQAIRKQKGLKAEVQNLKRDLLNKEAQLKEYDAIVDSERVAWRAERAQRSARK